MSIIRFCLFCIAAIQTTQLPAADDLFIGQVRVEDARAGSADSRTIHYQILHEDPALLEARLAEWISQATLVPGGVAFSLTGYPAAASLVNDALHRDASFLVDYNEPSVQELVEQINSQYGRRPAPSEVEQFVYDFIEQKNGSHGFDVASMVAITRGGDCT